MRKVLLWSVALFTTSACAAPALATAKAQEHVQPPCDAKYYSDLVGQNLDAARSISGSNYRLLPAGADRGKSEPGRMTVVYDQFNRIVEVGCG